MSSCHLVPEWDIRFCCQSCHKDEEINGCDLLEYYLNSKRIEVCCKAYRFLKDNEDSKG
jgi:hypothetical protein